MNLKGSGLPEVGKQSIGSVSFNEVTKDMYKMIAGEKVLRPIKGISVFIDLPANEGNNLSINQLFISAWILNPCGNSSPPKTGKVYVGLGVNISYLILLCI